jgi:hypothetical protein
MIEDKFDNSVFDQLPDFETFRTNLLKLKSIDLSSYSQDEIHRIVHQHTVFVPSFICLIPATEFGSYKMYRARFKVDPEMENVYLHSTFSYPNNSYCNQNGRANIKRRNVFYCAESAVAAILESKPVRGDTGCLSIWKPVVEREVKCAIFLKENLREANTWHKKAKELHNYLKDITPKFKKEAEEHLNFLNEFICNLFIEEKPPYCISSWLSNNLLYSHRGIDMILYPSSITDSYFTNIAIHPNFADRYLQLEKVFQFSINDINDKKLDYGIGLIGTPGTMNIEWRQPTEIEITEVVAALNIGVDRTAANSAFKKLGLT